jgi:hypothetical protein
MWEGYDYSLAAGTSTGRCADYTCNPGYDVTCLFFYRSIDSLTYS